MDGAYTEGQFHYVIEQSLREAIEAACQVARDMRKRKLISKRLAEKAGRHNVASHRQTDIETCNEIEQAIRRTLLDGTNKGD
jgi:hypothetical protein